MSTLGVCIKFFIEEILVDSLRCKYCTYQNITEVLDFISDVQKLVYLKMLFKIVKS